MSRIERRRLLAGAACALALAAPLAFAQAPAAPADSPRVQVKTSQGAFVVELRPDRAPKTVANFLQYVQDRHYDGTVFHRVMDGFMIQGGGFTPDMTQKPTRAPVALEARNGLKNDRYTIAMARRGEPDSATSQFFVNVKDNAMLDAPNPDGHGYTVFGRVVQGTEVVDRIRQVRTGNRGPHQNVPVEPVLIESVSLIKQGQ